MINSFPPTNVGLPIILGLGNADQRGFRATSANGGLPARSGPSDTVTYELALAESAIGIDGIYANKLDELAWIVGDDTYRKLCTLIKPIHRPRQRPRASDRQPS